MDLSKMLHSVREQLGKHAPAILTGIGITSMLCAVALAVKATPEAEKDILKARGQTDEELSAIDKVKACWKRYIPTAAAATVSAVSIIGANSVNAKRNAALATAYAVTDGAYRIFKEKTEEIVGKNKAQEIKSETAQEIVNRHPISMDDVRITPHGSALFYDNMSGRYFQSDMNAVKKVENHINYRMMTEMTISLNEFYDELGLDRIDIGDELGWDINRQMLELTFSTRIASNGQPCIVLEYIAPPRYLTSECY